MDVKAEKICRDCHTRSTPLWRAGPDGPRVRHQLFHRSHHSILFDLSLVSDVESGYLQSLCNACGLRFRKRMALVGLKSADSQKRRKRSPTGRVMKRQMKLKEEEEAAISLMALSCGSIYLTERHYKKQECKSLNSLLLILL